jgi:hypothetical protein
MERTTDHEQATGKRYYLRLRVECTLFCNLQSRAQAHALLVMGLYELLDPMTAEILLKVALKHQKSNQSLVICVAFCRSLYVLLAIVLSGFLRFTT